MIGHRKPDYLYKLAISVMMSSTQLGFQFLLSVFGIFPFVFWLLSLDFLYSHSAYHPLSEDKTGSLLLFSRRRILTSAGVAQLVGESSHTPNSCGFNSQSRYIPSLQVRSLIRARTGGNRSMFLSYVNVFLSLLSPLSKFNLKNPQVRI